jgi:hypothetical protein
VATAPGGHARRRAAPRCNPQPLEHRMTCSHCEGRAARARGARGRRPRRRSPGPPASWRRGGAAGSRRGACSVWGVQDLGRVRVPVPGYPCGSPSRPPSRPWEPFSARQVSRPPPAPAARAPRAPASQAGPSCAEVRRTPDAPRHVRPGQPNGHGIHARGVLTRETRAPILSPSTDGREPDARRGDGT